MSGEGIVVAVADVVRAGEGAVASGIIVGVGL